jgi:hypothetical protein
MKLRLIDSALILAILGGIFFAVGHVVEIRRAKDYGIDLGLMPVLPPEAVIFRGFLYTSFFLLVPAFFVVSGAIVKASLMTIARRFDRPKQGTTATPQLGDPTPSSQHPRWLGSVESKVAVAILVFILAMFDIILYMPIPPFLSLTRGDEDFCPVKVLRLKNGTTMDDLRFFSQRDGLIVFKKPSPGGFVCLHLDEIASLELGTKTVNPLAPAHAVPGLTPPIRPR